MSSKPGSSSVCGSSSGSRQAREPPEEESGGLSAALKKLVTLEKPPKVVAYGSWMNLCSDTVSLKPPAAFEACGAAACWSPSPKALMQFIHASINLLSFYRTNLRASLTDYRHKIRAAIVHQLQLIEGLGQSARVVRVGQEEPPVHRRPGHRHRGGQMRHSCPNQHEADHQVVMLLPPHFTTSTRAFSFLKRVLYQHECDLTGQKIWKCCWTGQCCWNSLVQDDVALQSSQELPGSSPVEVQRRQRVTSSAGQHQEVAA